MYKLKCKYTEAIVYFKFFASMKYPNSFWFTKTTENSGFDLGKIDNYMPINITWKELKRKSYE